MIFLFFVLFKYAGERLDSALKEHYHDYPNFKRMLNTAHIVIDKRILAQLALYEPRTFKVCGLHIPVEQTFLRKYFLI